MAANKNIIGVDLGGTNIRAGRVQDNSIVETARFKTPSHGTEKEVLDAVCNCISQCFNKQTKGIGIGVPSVVDTEKGIVYDVVNIPSWKEVALGDYLKKKFNVPVYINNDANCFVAGEKFFGKGKPYRNIVGLITGTGLGLGLIINNKLFDGTNCCAGEFGMLPYLDHNYEYYCSGQYFTNIKNTDAALEYENAKKGDGEAQNNYNEFGRHMGMLVKSILYAYDPDIIIMGGSLTNAFEFFKTPMYSEIKGFEFRNTLKNLKIEISEMEEPAILGAAALFLNAG